MYRSGSNSRATLRRCGLPQFFAPTPYLMFGCMPRSKTALSLESESYPISARTDHPSMRRLMCFVLSSRSVNTVVSAILLGVILHDRMTCSPITAKMCHFRYVFTRTDLKSPSFFDGLSCTPYLSVSTPVLSAAAMCKASKDAAAARLIRNNSPVRVLEASVSVGMAAAAAGRVIYADNTYSSWVNLCLCKECGVVPFIRLKKNAITAGRGRGDVWGMSVRG